MTDYKISEDTINKQYLAVLDKAWSILQRGNDNYGNSVGKLPVLTSDLGIYTACEVRMSDKINRLWHLLNGGQDSVDDSVEDSLYDLANYCLLWIVIRMWCNERKEQEVPSDFLLGAVEKLFDGLRKIGVADVYLEAYQKETGQTFSIDLAKNPSKYEILSELKTLTFYAEVQDKAIWFKNVIMTELNLMLEHWRAWNGDSNQNMDKRIKICEVVSHHIFTILVLINDPYHKGSGLIE